MRLLVISAAAAGALYWLTRPGVRARMGLEGLELLEYGFNLAERAFGTRVRASRAA